MNFYKFLEELANNTPHEQQFKKETLGKKQRISIKRRKLQVLQQRNNKHR
jgi:hypothetical protein